MPRNIIETHALRKTFGRLTAVDHLHLIVPQGSIYGFLGPNGAGKTTTIRMLLRLIYPTSGEVYLFGEPLARRPQALLSRIGALVEAPSYYPHLSGQENLELVRRLRGEDKACIPQVLDITHLQRDANRPVKQYSQGMRQRLGLAMALLGNPQLLILDEPTNGLDPAGIHEMRDLLRELPARFGVTIFVSSHLLNEVEQIATQVGILQNGELVYQGPPEQIHRSFQEKVLVTLDRPEAASKILRHNGWKTITCVDHSLVIDIQNPNETATINRCLVENGFSVSDLHRRQLSLEDIFLQLTEQPTQISQDI